MARFMPFLSALRRCAHCRMTALLSKSYHVQRAMMQPETARQLEANSRLGRYDAAAVLLLIAIAILIPLTVRHYGISNDEDLQHRYGELIIAYYASGFENRALFTFENLYLYGGLFDVTAIFVAKLLSADVFL